MQNLPRRAVVLAGSSLAIAGQMVPGIAQAASADAELVSACAVFETLEHQVGAIYDGPGRIEDDDNRQAAMEAIADRQLPWLERICELRAVTPVGWKAKARSFACWDRDALGTKFREGDPSERILFALLRDMLT